MICKAIMKSGARKGQACGKNNCVRHTNFCTAPDCNQNVKRGLTTCDEHSEKCITIIRSGPNRGQRCHRRASTGDKCKVHSPIDIDPDFKCQAILKSGPNKGTRCSKKKIQNNMCMMHIRTHAPNNNTVESFKTFLETYFKNPNLSTTERYQSVDLMLDSIIEIMKKKDMYIFYNGQTRVVPDRYFERISSVLQRIFGVRELIYTMGGGTPKRGGNPYLHMDRVSSYINGKVSDLTSAADSIQILNFIINRTSANSDKDMESNKSTDLTMFCEFNDLVSDMCGNVFKNINEEEFRRSPFKIVDEEFKKSLHFVNSYMHIQMKRLQTKIEDHVNRVTSNNNGIGYGPSYAMESKNSTGGRTGVDVLNIFDTFTGYKKYLRPSALNQREHLRGDGYADNILYFSSIERMDHKTIFEAPENLNRYPGYISTLAPLR